LPDLQHLIVVRASFKKSGMPVIPTDFIPPFLYLKKELNQNNGEHKGAEGIGVVLQAAVI
jgi:hypothetical protein